jgi:hypothetical protein
MCVAISQLGSLKYLNLNHSLCTDRGLLDLCGVTLDQESGRTHLSRSCKQGFQRRQRYSAAAKGRPRGRHRAKRPPLIRLLVVGRVGKNPVFFKKKTSPVGFLGFFGFFCPDERVLGFFSVSRILFSASRL